ncbi:Fe-S cluster assembly protein SufD [Telluribacter sp.]|jgi:Fe-S cluster assembly protein SufD|uniref:Fe-S cluster assembly protein SufD n=1 Tax=Telluribacter sp. TaxID=1978767 RepID=UPI002E116151|nr:Fe-S cluster assembly protein SufD [Telluribacter sp.]
MSTETIDLKTRLVTDFYAREEVMNGEAQSDFHQTKRRALGIFEERGFPTPRHEEWKYSNVRDMISHQYQFNGEHAVTEEVIDALKIANLSGNIIYIINGRYEASLSTLVSPPDQLTIQPLYEAIRENPELATTYFGQLAKSESDAFTALNTAFAHDGVFIQVPAGKVVEQPIILRFISDARTENVGSNPRNLFVVGRNAQVKMAESYRTIGSERSLTNTVTEIFVAEGANVEYYKVQNEAEKAYHVGTTHVNIRDNSHFYSATVTLNGGFIRNNLTIELDGQHCEAFMYGLYFPDEKQHIDNHTLADHRQPNSYSSELYKGVLRDRSTGVFNGKIFVRQDAQKTNAYQSCKNVVLSPDATMNTKPQLEIYADDVKCSHGTTTGQLDEEALFYMRSRGISKTEAMTLLMYAFCEDVISQIKIDAIREHLEGVITEKLAKK